MSAGIRRHGATVVVASFQHGGVDTNAFDSVKEMVQHYITQHSIAGGWWSDEQLEALEETKQLLDRTLENLKHIRAREVDE